MSRKKKAEADPEMIEDFLAEFPWAADGTPKLVQPGASSRQAKPRKERPARPVTTDEPGKPLPKPVEAVSGEGGPSLPPMSPDALRAALKAALEVDAKIEALQAETARLEWELSRMLDEATRRNGAGPYLVNGRKFSISSNSRRIDPKTGRGRHFFKFVRDFVTELS